MKCPQQVNPRPARFKHLYLFQAVCLTLIVGIYGYASQAQPTTKPNYNELLQRIWQTVKDHFYDRALLGVDWDKVGLRYQLKLDGIKDDAAFLSLMREMLRELPTSHLTIQPPATGIQTGIAVSTSRIDGRLLIASVDAGSDAQRRGLRTGDVLLTDLSQMRGAFGSLASLRLQGCDGRKRSVSVRREPAGWPFEQPLVRWRAVAQGPARQIRYLKIVHFDDGIAALIDSAMSGLKDTTGLIIDVRGNTGGNISYLRLTSYFTPAAQLSFALLSRPFLERLVRTPQKLEQTVLESLPKISGAYTDAAILDAMKVNGGGARFYTEDLGQRAFGGKVVVLINKETASAAEGFAWSIKGKPNTILIGRTTAGAVVGAERFPLPGGWRLRVPTHAAWGPDGQIFRDQAITLDIEVPLTRADLCAGRDADMMRALDKR